MSVDRWGPDAWFIAHPSFNANPNAHPEEFRMSYEFADFITGWALGRIGRTPFHVRNFRIAQRKSCYPLPLMNALGLFTPEGEKVLARAQQFMKQIANYYESIGVARSDVPLWDQVDTMDTIVLAGLFETKNIIFLKTMYNRLYPLKEVNLETTHLDYEMPNDVEFEFTEHNDTTYMLTAPLRAVPHKRIAFELLVKFGLVELESLPKPISQKGKGRAPVGATLTQQGIKFYRDYLNRYDPMRIAKIERDRMFNEIYKDQ